MIVSLLSFRAKSRNLLRVAYRHARHSDSVRDVSTPLDMTESARASDKKDPLAEEFLRYLANERNASPRTLKAYRQALAAFRAENQTPWKKCTGRRFSRLLICNCEARASAFVCAIAILSVAHVLSVSGGSKGIAQ